MAANTSEPTPAQLRAAQETGFVTHLRSKGTYSDAQIKAAHAQYVEQLDQRDRNVAAVVSALLPEDAAKGTSQA